jgi:RNA polymerase sigma-70 factor, ECF subfamily
MAPAEAETRTLLRRWHGGDRDALAALLERHLPAIREHVHRRLGPLLRGRAETSDLVQEALLEFLVYAPRFEVADDATFQALLRRVAENVLRDKVEWYTARRRAVSRERPIANDTVLDLSLPSASGTSPTAAAARDEREAWVRFAMELLENGDREVLVLHDWDGLSFASIAQKLGISESGARKRYHLALVRASQILGELRRGNLAGLVTGKDDAS